uniref:BTB domain-containing protein n=1 Tax=Plectus sambesii TaxID=2011161 RepID=A0A914V2G4_9BILA
MKTDSAAATNDRKNQVVLLDVGGRVFKTTEYTLLSVPNNYFCQLLQQSAQDQNESRAVKQIFIDRDGRLFEYIIGYMRDGSMIELPKDTATLNDLRKEAHFYSMPSLVQLVDARLLDPNRVIQLSVGGIHFSISASCCCAQGHWVNENGMLL